MLEEYSEYSSTINLANKQIDLLDDIIEELCKYHFLNTLILSYNNISDISSLVKLKKLEKLYLDNNKIEDISFVSELKDLDTLDLSNNLIINLSKNFFQNMSNLEYLNLSNNQLTTIPNFLLNLGMNIVWENSDSRDIVLKGNPLDIAPEIIQKGDIKTIKECYASQRLIANEVKVLLIGDGSSGKTSLLNRILYSKYNPKEDQTDGINIQSKEFKTDEKNITLNFWDFGGQEKFYSTHNFFFSKRSLYILLVDARKESRVEYWLEYIKTISDNSPVIVVMNKIDQNPDFDLNRRDLLKNHKNIKGFHKISCDTEEGLEDFYLKMLQVAINDVEMSQIFLPKGWYQVRENLKELGKTKDFISYEEFQNECEKNDIEIFDEKTQNILLDIYNDLGDITTYKHDNNQNILLNPNWIVEALYKIISYTEIKNGLLHYSDLKNILTDYPERKYKFIMNTMKEFKRCYDFKDGRYILPDLLTPNSGDDVINFEEKLNKEDTNSLQIEFKYKLLPSAIITKFIVNEYESIKDNMIWKTGLVLQNSNENSFAIIESHPTKKTIKIQVWGKEKDDFIKVLIEKIKELNNDKSFKNLRFKILVPLEEDSDGNIQYATYKALKGFLESDRLEYFDGELQKEFNILEKLRGKKVTNKKRSFFITIFGNIANIGDGNSNIDIRQNSKKSLI